MKRFALACALAAVIPVTAFAASPAVTGFGPRVGLSLTPDQLAFGGQMHVGEIAPSLTFDPNLEIGVGDNQTVVAMNVDLQYHFLISGSVWGPYLGGGLGVNFFSFDMPAPYSDVSETNVGANLIVGAEAPTRAGNRFFSEARFGLGDIPSLKLMVGWNFKI